MLLDRSHVCLHEKAEVLGTDWGTNLSEEELIDKWNAIFSTLFSDNMVLPIIVYFQLCLILWDLVT